jgi:hypothetical protein
LRRCSARAQLPESSGRPTSAACIVRTIAERPGAGSRRIRLRRSTCAAWPCCVNRTNAPRGDAR